MEPAQQTPQQTSPSISHVNHKEEYLSNYVQQLEERNEKQKQEIIRMKEQQQKWGQEWHKKLQQLSQHNQVFKDMTESLNISSQTKDEEILQLKAELNKLSAKLFLLEAREKHDQRRLTEDEFNKQRLENLKKEYKPWEKAQTIDSNSTGKIISLSELIQQKDEHIDQITTQYKLTKETVMIQTTEAMENKEKVMTLERKFEEKTLELDKLKSLFEVQKQSSQSKINAVEDKYTCIKNINIALEKELLHLQSELRKHVLPSEIQIQQDEDNNYSNFRENNSIPNNPSAILHYSRLHSQTL